MEQVSAVHVENQVLTGQSNDHLESEARRVDVGHREVTEPRNRCVAGQEVHWQVGGERGWGAGGHGLHSDPGSTWSRGRGMKKTVSSGAAGRGALSAAGPQARGTAERWGPGAA